MISADSFSFRLLTDDQIAGVHDATLAVLGKTGVLIEHPRALEILQAAGCTVRDEHRVIFPQAVVENAIRQAPASVDIHTRDGRPAMTLRERNVYYGTVTSLPFIHDRDGTRRPYTLDDARRMTIIADHLDTIEFATATGNSSDVPPGVSDVHEQSCIIEHSPKPLLITTHDEAGLAAMLDICAVHKGGRAKLAAEPFMLYCICPISPLRFPESVVGKLIMAVEAGLPYVTVPAPAAGGTAPVSVAGTLVTGNAEILASLVLTQALRPGAPFLYGGFFTNMDMATMVMTHGSPEFNLLNVAQAEMARHYGVPSFSSAGCTDAHEIDEQTAFECAFSTMATALGGANLVHAASVIGSGSAVSMGLLVLHHEFISYTQRFCAGIDTSDRMLAADEIAQAGPGGNFLESEMTLDLFKTEHWRPMCFNRDFYDNWVKQGSKTLRQCLAEKCDQILKTHRPAVVDDDKLAEIKRIIEASDRQRLA